MRGTTIPDIKPPGPEGKADFGTNASRSSAVGRGRFDLLPFESIAALARHMERGAEFHGEDNWRKGINLKRWLNSALRHLHQFAAGQRDEPHLIAAIWNLMCLYDTSIAIRRGTLPSSLSDIPEFQEWLPSDLLPILADLQETATEVTP